MALPGLPERAPGGHGDVRLFEDSFGERRAVHADIDAGEDVERATRTIGRESVDLLQFSQHKVSPRPELVDHGLQRTGRATEGRDACLLSERGRARDRVLLDFDDLPVHRRGCDEPAEPPARHRVRLREAVHGDGPVEHALQGRGRDMFAFVQDLLVDLVAYDGEVVATITFSGFAGIPFSSCDFSAIASRSSRIPGAAVYFV